MASCTAVQCSAVHFALCNALAREVFRLNRDVEELKRSKRVLKKEEETKLVKKNALLQEENIKLMKDNTKLAEDNDRLVAELRKSRKQVVELVMEQNAKKDEEDVGKLENMLARTYINFGILTRTPVIIGPILARLDQ